MPTNSSFYIAVLLRLDTEAISRIHVALGAQGVVPRDAAGGRISRRLCPDDERDSLVARPQGYAVKDVPSMHRSIARATEGCKAARAGVGPRLHKEAAA